MTIHTIHPVKYRVHFFIFQIVHCDLFEIYGYALCIMPDTVPITQYITKYYIFMKSRKKNTAQVK